METLARRYGEGTSLADFERKAQLMNYETYRAVFEGLQAHMWTKNSGRLLWMTHPAWPSNHWQIYTHDYDTHASYYGVKKATEPVHVQMNLPDYTVTVVNSTREQVERLKLTAEVFGLDGRNLLTSLHVVDPLPNNITKLPPINIKALVEEHGMVIVALRLRDLKGKLVSDNTYWQGKDDASHQLLNAMPQQRLRINAAASTVGDERVVAVILENTGKVAALATKLTLVDHMGTRILPARYTDNYLAVLPGEPRRVLIRYPAKFGARATVKVRGWNVHPASVRARDAGAVEYDDQQPYYQPPVSTPPVKVDSVTIKLPSK
jgi:Exo-beta-D-glucosaminidase Ig-fold domain